MQDTPDEVHDHDWHRSVWFGQGMVNGHDFWREIPARKTGSIVHDAIDPSVYHTDFDTFDAVQIDDLKQAAVVVAVTAYHLAMRPERLPR